MNESAQLVQSSLSLLIVPLFLLGRGLRKKFHFDDTKPVLPEAVIYGGWAALSVGLAFAQNRVSPIVATGVVDLWWVQGLLFFGALVLADLGSDATSIKAPNP